jgi:hypothetical protein
MNLLAVIFPSLSGDFKIDLLGAGLSNPTVFVESEEELDTVVNNLAAKGFSIEFAS